MITKIFKTLPLALAISSVSILSYADKPEKQESERKTSRSHHHVSDRYFQRVSVFPVCENLASGCDSDEETVAEIVAASSNGKVLIYTDSQQEAVGFVDISDLKNPEGIGTIALNGEPTSVAVSGRYAFVGVNTSSGDIIPGSEDADADLAFTRDMTGELAVFDMNSGGLVKTMALSGQPDSVAASPDGRYVAIVIENERDEDLCVGGLNNASDDEDDCEEGGGSFGIPGQGPAGTLDIVRLKGHPDKWTMNSVDMTGLAGKFPADPEPEYVDVNRDNVAVVTLQENNHILLVDLKSASIVGSFDAGDVTLSQIDTQEEDPAIISLTESVSLLPREADGVSWMSENLFATADEGDLDGGSRGFTIYNTAGNVEYTSGNLLDHLVVRFGHYPDARSGNKGNEPENVDYLKFHGDEMLAVASERSSVVFIFDVADPQNPVFKQLLPAGVAPEGVKAVKARNLLVAASEEDARGDKIRSVLNIYQYGFRKPSYPTIESSARVDGTPIPWGALSGLAAESNSVAYTVHDSFYQQSRIFSLNLSVSPAVIDAEILLKDTSGVLASTDVSAESSDDLFDSNDLAALINGDQTVNLDLEGIALASEGGFWVVSEGSGTVGDAGRPVVSGNLLLKVAADGVIEKSVTLPADVAASQLRFGFEGVAEQDGKVYVAMQRAWAGDDMPRIAVYDIATNEWTFFFYPLDDRLSPAGGWVGLSDITALGNGELMVVERDNQAGPDAAVKRLYRFSVEGLVDGDTLSKVLVDDLMDDLQSQGGLVLEKVEGVMVLPNGHVMIVNDNDGVDDSNGETQLLDIGKLF